MKYLRYIVTLVMVLAVGCSGQKAPTEAGPDDGVVITDEISTKIHTDDGDVGVVIDVRAIFKKGYVATTAEITFPDHQEFSATLDIDPSTNLAILSIVTDSLTEVELTAFAAGVDANIIISDAGGMTLADFHDAALVIDNSNLPLSISTDLPYVRRPVALREDLPYLLQLEGRDGLMSATNNTLNVSPDTAFVIDEVAQQFYFTPVQGSTDTYYVENFNHPELTVWRLRNETTLIFSDDSTRWQRADLVLEQDEDGWVKMRVKGTDAYLVFDDNLEDLGGVMTYSITNDPSRFRLISDDIAWQVADRGTVFNQPNMPPAMLDFAFKATLINCSAATLTETIGKSEQRPRTTTVSTSESLQLFSSVARSLDVKVGLSVTAKIGINIKMVATASVAATVSSEVSVGSQYTTSQTTSSENTWSASESITADVSRTRTLTLPPFTAIEAWDAVKTIDNVRVPFTQMLRITATSKDDGSALSGRDIQSQMLFNFVGGVVSTVGADFIDISFRGHTTIDQMFESTTNVQEIPGACD